MVAYTEFHLVFLREAYKLLSVEDVTTAFNDYFKERKTPSQIKAALSNHGIRSGRVTSQGTSDKNRLLTLEQDYFLRELYPVMTQQELLVALNTTYNLHLRFKQLTAYLKNNNVKSGRTGRFEKGHVPWTAGTKGKGICKPNSGCFKKGDVPINVKPLGHERFDRDGYVQVKVKERNPYTEAETRYKAKHVHLWEQQHGKIPKGHVVTFKNGDNRDFSPDNLELITRNELCRYNYDRVNDAPQELIPTLKTLVKLKVKISERAKEVE